MSIAPLPLTDLSSAAAAVVSKLRPWSSPEGVDMIRPGDRKEWLGEKQKTVGGSESPALLGIHPYLTAFELFQRKTGLADEDHGGIKIEENLISLPPLERGNFLEERAIDLARRLRPDWTILSNPIPGGVSFIDRARRMSSTPDTLIHLPNCERGTLQIKSVEPSIFRTNWKQDGMVEAPLWIAVQAMQDAILCGATRAFVGAMVIGFSVDFHLIEVPLHAGVIAKLRAAVDDFWRRVAEGDPPPADYARDGDVLRRLYADDDGSEIDLSANNRAPELIGLRDALKAREADGNAAKKAREPIDAELLAMLGSATRGRLADGRVIESKTVRRDGYQVAPTQYRSIKVRDSNNAASSRSRRGGRAQPAVSDHFGSSF